jgi:glucosamine--fructose-6-phosphate aminotransferase (isomerizing)
MCGIIAVLRREPGRPPPSSAEILELLEAAPGALLGSDGLDAALHAAATDVEAVDRLLHGVPGVTALLADRTLLLTVDHLLAGLGDEIDAVERRLDADGVEGQALERTNAALIRLKDAVWAVRKDRLRTARAVADLAGAELGPAAIAAYTSVQVALSALDRLEVRGRDSAGIHILVSGHGLDPNAPTVAALLAARSTDPLFASGSVRIADGRFGFVYKAAAEIGELGDNTSVLRDAIRGDALLRLALQSDTADAVVLGHTRWASVGIISQANAHPLNSEETDLVDRPYVIGELNGDVDNFADLQAADNLRIAPEITTDAKVIPTLVAHRLSEGNDLAEAFRQTVASFEGSVAIAAEAASHPDELLLALRGSGQALYVGFAEDSFVVASEPYGLVEETNRYLRLDGETPANPGNPTASRGQVVVLDRRFAGSLEGIRRIAYDGTEMPVTDDDLAVAEVTTRDIDRGEHAHFLLKEITEAPASFRKTLRGKLVEEDGVLGVRLHAETLSPETIGRLRDGDINRVIAVGQGTAAVAAQSVAASVAGLTSDTDLRVEAALATELSGFGLRADMRDTLVVAISQSGTTTDTNRTVDLARSRGATVVSIVNRRNSDLVDKSDGVLYTSDGRDVEMSVPSTKAFYSQIAAGFLLAVAIADAVGASDHGREELLRGLRGLPDVMTDVLGRRAAIAVVAQQLAPGRRYWAIVGNGLNRIAALEVRIKLSELCYKSIAFDATEDKKHVDLSAEPLILVCAAGLTGSNADDVAKEVAIYRAHKAAPIVIATEGEGRFGAALQAITVPATHPKLAYVLSAMAGHLFGYEAALAIDAQARPLREARAAIEASVSGSRVNGDRLLDDLRPPLAPLAARFWDGLRSGAYDGNLAPSTAVRLSSLFRYALAVTPLDNYQLEHGKVGTPAVVVDDLTGALTVAIEELTRPVDAIKHQAKTVTVGISRADETLLQVPLVQQVLAAGSPRDGLTYRTLRTLADLDPAVAEVTGFIRYRVEPGLPGEPETVTVVDRGGISQGFPSRTERNPVLRGTKHTIALEREPLVFRGRSDARTLVGVPEVKDNETIGLVLLHVRFQDRLPAATVRGVLQGYRNRFAALHDAVTETEPTFREDLLADIPVVELLTEPVHQLADRWRPRP